MWIDSLALDKVFDYPTLALTFDQPINLFFGVNESGKTSLARAIELLLTGEVLGLRGTGVGIGQVVRDAGPSGSVTGTARPTREGKPLEIRRRITGKGVTTTVDGGSATKGVYDLFARIKGDADPAAVFRVLMNITGFFELAAGEPQEIARRQKALLFGLIDQSVPEGTFAVWPEGLGPVPTTLGQIDAAFHVVSKRLSEKRRERDAITVDHAILATLPVDDAMIAEIEARVVMVRAEKEQRITAQGEASGRRAVLTEERAAMVADVDDATAKIVGLGAHEAAVAARDAAQRALDAADQAATAYHEGSSALRELQGRRGELARQFTALASLGAACVITPVIVCPLDEKGRKSAALTLDERMTALDAQITEARQGFGNAPTNQAELRKAVQMAERRIADIATATTALETAQASLVNVDAALAALPAEDPEIGALEARLTVGQGRLTEARRLQADRAQAVEDQAAQHLLAGEIAALDTLREQLGPTGIREKLLMQRLGTLQDRVNEILAAFRLKLSFWAEPWQVLLNGKPAGLMAESALWRAGLAFQIALAEVTGAGLVVVDRADKLDRRNRGALIETLRLAVDKGWVAQTFVLSTYVNPAAHTSVYPEGFAVYHVQRSEIVTEGIVTGSGGSTVTRAGGPAAP